MRGLAVRRDAHPQFNAQLWLQAESECVGFDEHPRRIAIARALQALDRRVVTGVNSGIVLGCSLTYIKTIAHFIACLAKLQTLIESGHL